MEFVVMIPQRRGVVTHLPHEAQFQGLFAELRMEEGSHRDIPRIDEQTPPGGLRPLLPDQVCQSRVAALRGVAAPRFRYPVGKKMGMEIMGKQDGQFPARIRRDARVPVKRRQQTEQNGQADRHTVSPHLVSLPDFIGG